MHRALAHARRTLGRTAQVSSCAAMIGTMICLDLRRCLVGLALLGCASASAAEAAAADTRQRRVAPFQNNYIEFAPKGVLELMRWQWESARQGLPRKPQTATPTVPADLKFITANAGAGAAMVPAATWIGHASVLMQMGGLNVLTDPIFSARASPFSWIGPQRAQAPGLALAELPRVDAVLISHNHYDHCDAPSLLALNGQAGGPPLFVVPLGLKAWLAELGITNVVELDWWQSHPLGALEIVLTPVQHWSARGLGDRMASLWGGYALFAPDFHLFFSGDTGYSADFADIHARFAARQAGGGFDLALLPLGAYEPRWFMAQQHVNPEEALRIHLDLGAQRSLGIHWGTFELADEALDEPPRALARARQAAGVAETSFFVMAIGETRRLPRRGSAQ